MRREEPILVRSGQDLVTVEYVSMITCYDMAVRFTGP